MTNICYIYTLLIKILSNQVHNWDLDGCFGVVVVKAEAARIKKSDEISETMTVKMSRSQTNVIAIEDLVSEIHVLICLG